MQSQQKPTITRFIVEFCLIELILSIPFWLVTYFARVGALGNLGLNNGYPLINWSWTPAISACILAFHHDGIRGVRQLLARCVDFRRMRSRLGWLLPLYLLWPVIIGVMYLTAIFNGQNPPAPEFTWQVPWTYVILIVGVLGEELGWTGYLVDPLQDRFGALRGAIIVGLMWATFHGGVFVAYGWSVSWIFWQGLYLVAARILFVWIYNNTGRSLFAIALLHPTFGCYYGLWPVNADGLPNFYDPAILALTTIFIALVVVAVYGPKTLSRTRPQLLTPSQST